MVDRKWGQKQKCYVYNFGQCRKQKKVISIKYMEFKSFEAQYIKTAPNTDITFQGDVMEKSF